MAQSKPFKKVFAGRPVITVTDHALTRARSRFRDDEMERDAIKEDVREAIKAGRIHDRKPPAFTLYKQKAKRPGPHHYVLTDEGENRAWIVALDKPREVVVVTSLSRAWAEAAA